MPAISIPLTSAHTAVLMLSLLSLSGVFVGVTVVEEWIGQAVVVIASMVVLVVGVGASASAEKLRQRTIRHVVFAFAGLISLLMVTRPLGEVLVLAALRSLSPEVAETVWHYTGASIDLALLVVLTMYVFTLIFLRGSAPLGRIERDPLIRDASYREQRDTFTKVLASHLMRVDDELRWHQRDFVELRAEVDVRNGDRARRRVVDLVEAIKQNADADIFVVIGVPGAGKSVALRKSCGDLLAVQRPDERIPVYVNLKEWTSERKWSTAEPPTHEEFAEFVRRNVRDRLSDSGRAFFEEHFDRLRMNGELFFMFDSFDEIPGILDADETSKLLDAVSGVVVTYLRSAANARGVIASRHYRRPRLGQERHAQLEVRPFSERQIAEVLRRGTIRSAELERILFVERPDLGAIARNPFALSLILLYWESRREAPPNQSELYAAYIARSLEDAGETLSALGLSAEELQEAMTEISWAMFESDRRGLEMSVHELRETLGRDDIDKVVDALVAARLARKAPRTQAVSFVHRRFNEYFLVARWLSGERELPFEAVPTDSRYRDALVLYAEVASEEDATELALSCWREIEPLEPDLLKSEEGVRQVLRAIYSLRFLGEAFRARPGPVMSFRDALGGKVRDLLSETDDLLYQKIAVETVGLLGPSDAEEALLSAMDKGSSWLQEAAFGACRYLGALPKKVEHALIENLLVRSQLFILNPDRDLNYMLTVSDVFRPVLQRFRAARIDTMISLFSSIVVIVLVEMSNRWVGVIFVMTVALMSVFLAIIQGKFLRFEIERGVVVSRVLTGTEFLIGTFRATPIVMLALFVGDNWSSFYYYIVDGQSIKMDTFGASVGVEIHIYIFVLCLGAIPFIGGVRVLAQLYATGMTWMRCLSLKRFVILLLQFGVFFGVCGGIIYPVYRGVYMLPDTFRDLVLGSLLWFCFLVFMVIFLNEQFRRIRRLRIWLVDRRRLKSSVVRFVPSRVDIATAFECFEGAWGRARYVEWVEREAATPDHLKVLEDIVANPWPGGCRPNRDNDLASTRLAQLDERWLKLDV